MKTRYPFYLCGLCFMAFSPLTALSEPTPEGVQNQGKPALQLGQIINGKVIDVASGETFTMVTPDHREIEVWLAEIEAPEKGQVYWTASKQVLAKKVLGIEVTIQVVSTKDLEDGYDYVIAQAYVGNRWINKEMVAEGWAWHFPQYFQSRELVLAEQQAKEKNLGLWAVANPETPWEYQTPARITPEENQIQPLLKVEW